MKKFFLVAGCLLLVTGSFAQTVSQKLQKAFQQFESDAQLKHAISSLYVINAKTGKVVFDKNSQIGLAPASTQKIITSVTAFELLGKDYRYKTGFYYKKQAENLSGIFILVRSTGDPTLGSWRYQTTKPDFFFSKMKEAFEKNKASLRKMNFFIPDTAFEFQTIPDGWIWQDIGNYYGAGTSSFNWKENQADIELTSGKEVGDPVKIENYDSIFPHFSPFNNLLQTAAKGTGDNAYYYFAYGNSIRDNSSLFKGTIPLDEKRFKISIAIADPSSIFIDDFKKYNESLTETSWLENDLTEVRKWLDSLSSPSAKPIYTHYSPSLDSIIYWFLKKSINLYGEALVKTMAYEKKGFGSTDSGVAIVKDFWKQKGLGEDELNIYDGSGLSPLNRVTTHAQVEILKYAKGKSWYPYFYDALPEFNDMKMKSGTISNVKGFCGYHKAKDGNEYIFSFLVNNYNGPASGLVNKMYKVLDVLK